MSNFFLTLSRQFCFSPMTHPLHAIFLSLLSTLPLFAQGPPVAGAKAVQARGTGIDIVCEGVTRLSAGAPGIPTGQPGFTGLTGESGRFSFHSGSGNAGVSVKSSADGSIFSFFLSPGGTPPPEGGDTLGLFFAGMPGFARGVSLWRYGPWNSWSKPVRVSSPGEIHADDVQFFYWQYEDGLYGAAMPISGNGYRSTLGEDRGRFGSKSVSIYGAPRRGEIPCMSVGFGHDPYALFESLWSAGMSAMGHPENLRKNKTFPAVLENIGWCTWNSSLLGKNLNEDLLLKAANCFRDAHFPVGWFLVDDGWLDQTGARLNSVRPDAKRFPRGFREIIRTLRDEYGVKNVGVWHALNGYWEGINPSSELGTEYAHDLITYRERSDPGGDTSRWRTCAFLSPSGDAPARFYDELHRSLHDQGFTFVKVDNQLVVERIAGGNFPVWDGAVRYHAALNASVARWFGNTLINCMDMTPDAWGNFGTTAVARTSEDYFPYEKGETYDLQRGNAVAHVLQAMYNSLYFSQMVYPDFDEFQSHNPNALVHAIARAINDGPVYITDNIGEGNFSVLRPLVYSDGKIIRSGEPLLPARDCLFQVQDPKPFKAFSRASGIGLLGLWNCADADSVEGTFRPSDVEGMPGGRFALFDRMSGTLVYASRDESIPVSLGRLGCRLVYVIPLTDGMAPIGLIDKYNAPATLLASSVAGGEIRAALYEGGTFAAVGPHAPRKVYAGGAEVPFTFRGGLVTARIPSAGEPGKTTIRIVF